MGTVSEGLETRKKVSTMLDQGIKPRQIALALNLTTQRVYQIKAILRAIEQDRLEREGAAS